MLPATCEVSASSLSYYVSCDAVLSSDVCISQTEIEAIRDDIAPTWLQHPLSLEQTADKYVRTSLQQVRSAASLSHARR